MAAIGDHAASAEPGEAAAQRGKCRHGRGKPSPPGFGDELAALAKSCFRYGSDQALVIDFGWQQSLVSTMRQVPLYRGAPIREKVELLFRHAGILCASRRCVQCKSTIPTEKSLLFDAF